MSKRSYGYRRCVTQYKTRLVHISIVIVATTLYDSIWKSVRSIKDNYASTGTRNRMVRAYQHDASETYSTIIQMNSG